MNSAVVFTSEQLTILNTLNQKVLSGEIVTFDDTVVSGATPITIDALSGVASFTNSLSATSLGVVTINNELISSSSFLNIGLKYPSVVSGGVLVIAGYTCGTGYVEVFVYNLDSAASSSDIVITFQILNP